MTPPARGRGARRSSITAGRSQYTRQTNNESHSTTTPQKSVTGKRNRSPASRDCSHISPSLHGDSIEPSPKRQRKPSYKAASSIDSKTKAVSTPRVTHASPIRKSPLTRDKPETQPGKQPFDEAGDGENDHLEVDTGLSFFEAHRGNIRTSNFTLASLNVLQQEQLNAALQMYKDPFASKRKQKYDAIRKLIPTFCLYMSAGHSVLLYGFGSKRNILIDLAQQLSHESPVLVINGFNPTLSVRSVLAQLANLLELRDFPKRSVFDYVDAITAGLVSGNEIVSLVVHNIDGPSLRQPDAQHALSRLAASPKLRLAASVDHVNAALLWDTQTYDGFGWMWVRCNTFSPYDVETTFSTKPLLRGGTERRVDGAVALLRSLSERARNVFRELSARQQTVAQTSLQARPTFNELYETTKQKFLVSDPATLRTILNELSTHDLLQSRRGADSAERLWVPLDETQLKEVLKKIHEDN